MTRLHSVPCQTRSPSAETLNQACHCVALNRNTLRGVLASQPQGDALYRMIAEDRPHLLAASAVFVDANTLARQKAIIAAVERVLAMPAYQARVLAHAPASAHHHSAARGVFMGYDFHLDDDGPKLIEINTNAGGAAINILMARAYDACSHCPWQPATPLSCDDAEQAIVDMFRREWQRFNPQKPLKTLAIVDEQPNTQYMWPEFVLFQTLFRKHGLDAVICDAADLCFEQGQLLHRGQLIDLAYNRLTDFGLEAPQHQALRQAYLADAAVITPHPNNHAIYADKRNLALLTDDAQLREFGVDADTRALLLNGIARTVVVAETDAERLWSQRKLLFFKPARGYGSKAAYRGDKLTRRVFSDILHGDYVAQTLIQPSERQVLSGDDLVTLKLDVRHFVYDGDIQWISARLYQGQTTNFRTPGGGFAQVVSVGENPT